MTRRTARIWSLLLVAGMVFAATGSGADARPEQILGTSDVQDAEAQQPDDAGRTTDIGELSRAVDALTNLIANPPPATDGARVERLRAATVSLRAAYRSMVLNDEDGGPAASGHNTYRGLTHVQDAALEWRDELGIALEPVAAGLAGFVRTLADRMVGAAERAGVDATAERAALALGDRLAAGQDYAGSAGQYLIGFDVQGRMKFDIEVFRQNIITRFQNNVVGFAYSINRAGSHYISGSSGQARTNADGNTSHTQFKEQFVASVSKHVFGTAMLKALQDANVSVDSPIAPFLPPNWTVHATANTLTFEDVFTHHSGLAGQASDWNALRTRFGQSFPSLPDVYDYENANFGLMRILLPRVIGQAQAFDNLPAPFQGFVPLLYAAVFMKYVKEEVMDPIGMSAGICAKTDQNDTRYYPFPNDGIAGRVEGAHVLTCGGVGLFVSSLELARFLAHLRWSENIISTETRDLQDEKFLGYTHPDSPAFSGRVGDFGVYHSHGGDWSLGGKDAHACVMKYPINVEVSVVMNSPIGGSPSQCPSLRDAFDNAWVPVS